MIQGEVKHPEDYFVVGGTLKPSHPSYVQRQADRNLLHYAETGELCYVLTTRQMGKSSLMTRTSKELRQRNICTAIVDLSMKNTTAPEAWYLSILSDLQRELRLTVDLDAWWRKNIIFGASQCFTNFLRDVVLVEINERVVIFFDEIDSTLNLNFTDNFFAALRSMYNARAYESNFNRLTFVLLGMATPSDLIKDRSRTPFNIGEGIDLREFSRLEAQVLQKNMGVFHPHQSGSILNHIFRWTHGSPYLTQKLCLEVARVTHRPWANDQIDQLIEKLFLCEDQLQDVNLQTVQNNINSSPQRQKLLQLYRKIYEGKKILEDEHSIEQSRLKLFGLIRAERGVLKVRNEIYRQVFNLEWIKENTPVDWNRRIAVAATTATVVLLLAFAIFMWQQGQLTNEALAADYVETIEHTNNPIIRLDTFARFFDLPDQNFKLRAVDLFNNLPNEEKITLFESDSVGLEPELITVISNVYIPVTPAVNLNNELLEVMVTALKKSNTGESKILATEISRWLEGRLNQAKGDPEMAKNAYSVAIDLNANNPATLYERAIVLNELQDQEGALTDLEATLNLNMAWQTSVQEMIMGDQHLYNALWANPDQYAILKSLISTPTPTSTPFQPATATPINQPLLEVSSPAAPPLSSATSIATVSPTPSPASTLFTTPALATATPLVKLPSSLLIPYPSPTPSRVVAFSQHTEDGLNSAILSLVQSDGANPRQDSLPDRAFSPAWSNDGTRLAFVGEPGINIIPGYKEGEGIWVIDFKAGTPPRQLIAIDHAKNVVWSPDDINIAFEVQPPHFRSEIVIIDTRDGSQLRRFSGEQPAWTHNVVNPSLIIKACPPTTTMCGLWQVDLDGNPEHIVTTNSSDSYPALSPDGEHLVFSSNRQGSWDIYLAQPNGQEVQRLTTEAGVETRPTFSPDGQEIYYLTNTPGSWWIMAMNPDGNNKRVVKEGVASIKLTNWNRLGIAIK